METNHFNILIISFVVFFSTQHILSYVLGVLNKKNIQKHKNLPAFFSSHISDEQYQKSQKYTLEKMRFHGAQGLFSSVITLVLLFSGVLPALEQTLVDSWSWASSPLHRGVCFFLILTLGTQVLQIPFNLYETFYIEARYGFNKTTWRTYWIDSIKGVLIGLLLGIPFLYAVLWFLNFSGAAWWIWTFAFLTAFQIIMMVLYPLVLAPLFNKFKPLEAGNLKNKLQTLAERTQFPTQGIYVMDGSRRSGHSNAYFTGFGKLRRIVLFDTLLEQMTEEEMEGILCHEIGHYKRGHIYQRLLFQIFFQGLLLWGLSLAIEWPTLYQSFGFFTTPEELKHVGLFLFFTLMSTYTFFSQPLMSLWSRIHEYQADAYAVEHSTNQEALETALLQLANKNLSNLTPHPWYSAFYYTHPTIFERISAMRGLRGV